ncbi:MAG: phosphatase PAP2 family protein [Actinomycetes bacterium]
MTVTTLAVSLVVVLVLGWLRRTWLVAVTVCAAVVGASVTTQVLKRVVINRPPTLGELARISTNSFPSGHATICTVVALGALLMTGQRWRRVALVVAAVWVTFQCTGVVTSGWHRPSDTLAGYAVALAWAAAAIWVLATVGQVQPEQPRPFTSARTRSLVMGVAAVSVTGLLVGVSVGGDSTLGRSGAAYVGAILVLILCGLLTVWWCWELLDGWHVGPPAPLGVPETPSVPSADASTAHPRT